MIHKLAIKISNYFKKMNALQADQEIYTYGIELILGDVFNLLILFIVACFLNRILEMVLWSVVFLVSRKYTGGFHAPTHLLCILTVQIGFIGSYLICENLSPSAYILFEIITTVLGIFVLVGFGPIGSPKKPVSFDLYQKMKNSLLVYLLLISSGLLVLMLILSDIKFILYAFSAYLLTIILIPAGYLDNKIRCGVGNGVILET